MNERRFLDTKRTGVRLEQRAEGQPPTIVGYGAVFYDAANAGTEYDLTNTWGGFVERVMPGAFDRAVREDDVRALFNHDPNQILGRTTAGTLRLSVDKVGLRYEIEPPNTDDALGLIEAICRGDVSGSSFSFTINEQVWRDVVDPQTNQTTTIRELTAVTLYDLGPVTFPAYEGTSAGVRSAADLGEAQEELKRWRDTQSASVRAAIDQAEARARCIEIEVAG